MDLDLKQDVFMPVVEQVKKRSDSLRNIKRFPKSGIEGWFKVEIVAALGNMVTSVNNKGPDLTLMDGKHVEVKAATNFETNYCVGPVEKYDCPSLFLGDATGHTKLTANPNVKFEIVGLEVFSDGNSDWVVRMVKPKELASEKAKYSY